MKKFVFAVTALLVATAMAAPVMADDRVSLSGSMQVRGFYYDDDNNGAEDSGAWNDSRLRVGGKIAVADGVSVNFRADAVESDDDSSDAAAWGGTPYVGGATQYIQRRGDIQFDKAYLQFEKAGVTVAAGQNYYRQGMTGNMLDVVGAGFKASVAGLNIQHVKVSDRNDGNDSFTKTATPESSLTGLMYAIKAGDVTITPMVAYRQVSGDGEVLGLGVDVAANLGAVGVKGALEYFDGEDTTGATDLVGLQLYLDASGKISDVVTVGGMLLYAAGTDDAGEDQITHINGSFNNVDYTFADFSPLTYGFHTTDFVVDIDPFEIAADAGMQALQVYADVKMSDTLKGKFAVGFAQADEDKVADVEATVVNAGLSYAIAANTTLSASVNWTDQENKTAGTERDTLQAISGLYVKF